ncbi:MAG: ABC transporter substrate-binding protein [Armatimonadetes bacterium]|nr:ABC transporter substrate-binding protein [Armatimonadota bacterium]
MTRCFMLALWMLCLSVAGTAQQSAYVTSNTLRGAGMDLLTLTFAAVTSDGTVVGYDRPPLEEKMQGAKYRVWLVRPSADGRLPDVRSIPLDIGTLDQIALTPDDRALVAISDQGADFRRISLADGAVSMLMEHQPGSRGFRTIPFTLFRGPDRLVTTGYFYDPEDFAEETTVATLDPQRQGIDAFSAGPEFGSLERQLENLYWSIYADPTLMFFSTQTDQEARVYSWTPTRGLQPIDRGKKLTGGWGEGRALIYGMDDEAGSSKLVLVTGPDARQVLAENGQQTFFNPCVSPGAETVLAELGKKGTDRVSVVYGTADGGWSVSPVPGLENTAPGIVRLSYDGKSGLFYNPTGLRLIRF